MSRFKKPNISFHTVLKHGQTLRDQLLQKLKGIFQASRQFMQNIPPWLKSRPQAFKDWRVADKKKRKYRSFRLQKKLRPEPGYVPTAGQILRQALKLFRQNFAVFFWLMVVHGLLYTLFVRTGSNFDLKQAQDSISQVLGNSSGADGTLALLGSVISSPQQRAGSAGYSIVIFLFMSLAYVWAIRRIYTKTAFKVRDALYQAMSPVVPVVLTLLVIAVQSLPFSITSYVYIIGRSNGLFMSGIEDLSFFLIAFFCGVLSLYWMTPTIMSLYAVTLPNMYPLTTLQLTKKIVKFRRFIVFRRILVLPIIASIIYFGLLLLCIRFAPQFSPWLVELLPILLLPLIHAYYFNLYRSLV